MNRGQASRERTSGLPLPPGMSTFRQRAIASTTGFEAPRRLTVTDATAEPLAGYTARPATMDDSAAVAALIEASDWAEYGEPDYSEEELRTEWGDEDLPHDTHLVFTPDGQVVGYGNVYTIGKARIEAEGYVHPDFYGRGIGSTLVRWSERRAAEHLALAPPELRVVLNNAISARNPRARAVLEHLGYAPVRYFWRMTIDLNETPALPVWPSGITVRTVVGDDDERLAFEAVEDAFRDHWGHSPRTFDRWVRDQKLSGYRPALWFLAETATGEIAGAAINRYFLETMGWVGSLAVRRPWRGQGLGMALLQHTFGEFYRRGTRRVGLGVDAQNPTGATRLYERAGMTPKHEYAIYQKELRPGVEEPGEPKPGTDETNEH